MARWSRQRSRSIQIDGACFGRVETMAGAEPDTTVPARCAERARLFTAKGRLDNRDELRADLGPPVRDRPSLSDADLMLAAYDRWGEACAERLLGDWSFAAWHAWERRLVLARDQFGNTALYHARVGDRLAFASDVRALLALPWVPRRLNEIRLARTLVATAADPEEDDSGTIYRDVSMLLPAHTLVVTRQTERRRRYWQFEPDVRANLPSDAAYAEALLDSLRVAVRSRVPGDGPVGATLSGGLDSTAVSLLASAELAGRGERLTAFTSVSAVEHPWVSAPGRLDDEGPLAGVVARSAPNIDHVLIEANAVSPIGGARAMLRIHGEPRLSAGNGYWVVALLAEAARRGVRVLLTGQQGNSALSWSGPPPTWLTELRRKRPGRAARLAVHPFVPPPVRRLVNRYRLRPLSTRWDLDRHPWRLQAAIRTDFALAAGLDPAPAVDPPSNARHARAMQLRRAAWHGGGAWQQLGAAFGMSVRDPSQDLRLMSLAFAMPDRLWRGPMDRWLFREATRGLLPDAVRLNRRRGLQGADIVDRLRRHRGELDEALSEIEASPLARHCLDLPYCRRIVAAIDGPPDPVVASLVRVALMRALSAGLFLAAFERTGMVEP